MKYSEFLKEKLIKSDPVGFDVKIDDLNPMLFDWQKVLTRWALNRGRAALFEDCGLGKTPQQLEWANQIFLETGGDVLILAPLAVSKQTQREGIKFGIDVNVCRSQDDVKPGINITNYEMLEHFNASHFIGIVLDESSILKSFMGKTKQKIIDTFRNTQYKLCATATPSPNDHMELLNHAEFLNVMPSNEALSRWFINDTMSFGTYRLKAHAVKDFWRWVSSWAVCMRKPADIGYDDDRFILPELKTTEHIIDIDHDFSNGKLFYDVDELNASSLYRELRKSAEQRATIAAGLVNNSDEMWVVWCNTNAEADWLKRLIPDAVDVRGSMPSVKKEKCLADFSIGAARVMVTKPSMCGFGLNWQHVHNVAFVGLSYSFEQRYQALRRCWRYGQDHIVNDHVILSPSEKRVYEIVQAKEAQFEEMSANMVYEMRDYTDLGGDKLELTTEYDQHVESGENWTMILGDAVQETKNIKDESVQFEIFSPPFSSLYIYSDSLMDMGNSKDDDVFFEHFEHLIPELYRILAQGRLCAVHCKDLVDYKARDGRAGLRDFPGRVIAGFEKHGFKYHSRVTIWKDPVVEMQRTKSQGLLHKQVKKDTSMSRQGLPDYLLLFRRWPDGGDTQGDDPIIKAKGFTGYIGKNKPDSVPTEGNDLYSIHVWQRYASPVWFDIHQTRVLNARVARDDKDEKHICPLQLDVIARSLDLWTHEGDTVFSPFAGIGSEGYEAIRAGRKFIGIELKEAYMKQAIEFLKEAERKPKQMELFG